MIWGRRVEGHSPMGSRTAWCASCLHDGLGPDHVDGFTAPYTGRPRAQIRMLQLAIQSVLDICAHLRAREGWGLPNTYVRVIVLSVDSCLIRPEIMDTYRAMARFRSHMVHLYDDVDSQEILAIVRDHLDDSQSLAQRVTGRYLDEGRCATAAVYIGPPTPASALILQLVSEL